MFKMSEDKWESKQFQPLIVYTQLFFFNKNTDVQMQDAELVYNYQCKSRSRLAKALHMENQIILTNRKFSLRL